MPGGGWLASFRTGPGPQTDQGIRGWQLPAHPAPPTSRKREGLEVEFVAKAADE